jgi:hypothetical protein
VIDGNFSWRTAVDDLVARLRFPHVVFTLKVPLSVCLPRDAGRRAPLGSDAVREVYEKATTFDYGVGVDATGAVEDVVARMVQELKGSRVRELRPGVETHPHDR